MCDNNSNAKAGVISFTTDSPRIISFKRCFTPAAGVKLWNRIVKNLMTLRDYAYLNLLFV
jgi:hypothetical protein